MNVNRTLKLKILNPSSVAVGWDVAGLTRSVLAKAGLVLNPKPLNPKPQTPKPLNP